MTEKAEKYIREELLPYLESEAEHCFKMQEAVPRGSDMSHIYFGRMATNNYLREFIENNQNKWSSETKEPRVRADAVIDPEIPKAGKVVWVQEPYKPIEPLEIPSGKWFPDDMILPLMKTVNSIISRLNEIEKGRG